MSPTGHPSMTPDLVCDCGHRRENHILDPQAVREAARDGDPACSFCECHNFRPRTRGLPQPARGGDWMTQARKRRRTGGPAPRISNEDKR